MDIQRISYPDDMAHVNRDINTLTAPIALLLAYNWVGASGSGSCLGNWKAAGSIHCPRNGPETL